MTLDQWFRHLWQRVSPQQKWGSLGAAIAGLLVHLYAFTNLIPNSDGLSRVYDTQQMTISGRWFLHYASALNNYTQMPMVIGVLSVMLLALTAALVVDVLQLRSRVVSGLAGAVLAAFPCLGYTFLYLFTAAAYCVGIFLAVLSVWLTRRGKAGFLLGVAALALAMGIYQAYVTVAITLALLVVVEESFRPESTFRSVLRTGLIRLGQLAAGTVVYYITLLIFLKVKGLTLLSYLGMDAVESGYPIRQIPRLVVTAYYQVVAFFFLPGSANGFANGWMVAVDCLALVLGVTCLVLILRQKSLRQPWRLLGVGVGCVLLPLGMNFTQLMSPYSSPTPLMKYAFVSVYLLVLLVVDRGEDCGFALCRGIAPATALWAAVLLLFCLNTNNLLYTASAQAHKATESYLTRLMTRVEDCDGYEPGMEVVIIGTISEDQLSSSIESYAQVSHYSVPEDGVPILNKHIYYYLNDWLNIPVEEPEEDTMIAVAASEAFQEMPLYPAQGSVQVVDGRVVVKLSDHYTPKQDYEIAYEGRK